MIAAFMVFVGGGLGSLCRYALSVWIPTKGGFPLATLIANVLACLVLGFLTGLMLKNAASDNYKLLIGTGFCGGFSTFSTFSKETLALLQEQALSLSFWYVGFSLILGLVAVFFGLWLSRWLGI